MSGINEVKKQERDAIAAMSKIPHKVLVMSGKGGVGKTTVAVNLAYAFASMGKSVGIMDADLHGPNVALMTGIEGIPVRDRQGLLEPVVAFKSVRVLSIASFLPETDCPIVWRGPRKAGAIRQFLGQGDWQKIDLLVVDCPPGTGDEPMAVAEMIPDADGVVIVTSPQDVSLLDSRKCVNFVREINQSVLGIVENFSGFTCPSCRHQIDLFKKDGGRKAAIDLDIPLLGQIPITENMVECGDKGRPLVNQHPSDPAAIEIFKIAENIAEIFVATERRIAKNANRMPGGKQVVIAAEDDKGLQGSVSEHFGRCPFYIVANTENDSVSDIRIENNPHYRDHKPGQMPRFIHDLGADVILAGGMGPKAIDMFHSFNIEVVTGAVGNAGKVLDAYLRGEIKGIVPCSHDHPESCGAHSTGHCGHH